MAPGDAVIWDRWTFHRGVPSTTTTTSATTVVLAVVEEGEDSSSSNTNKKQTNGIVDQLRYSVRYVPSNAIAKGFVHYSVTGGSEFDSHHYPQVWPNLIPREIEALRHRLDSDVAISIGNMNCILLYLKYKIKCVLVDAFV